MGDEQFFKICMFQLGTESFQGRWQLVSSRERAKEIWLETAERQQNLELSVTTKEISIAASELPAFIEHLCGLQNSGQLQGRPNSMEEKVADPPNQ